MILWSHPTRGEWIEMLLMAHPASCGHGLTPHGVSGLKWFSAITQVWLYGLTPHGVSGLKYLPAYQSDKLTRSHPTRGEWIEIWFLFASLNTDRVSPHTGWVDWNSGALSGAGPLARLTPHGVSGLKCAASKYNGSLIVVSPHTGWVDWNRSTTLPAICTVIVSPHTGWVGYKNKPLLQN